MALKHYRENDEPVPGYRLVSYLGRGGFGEVWKAAGPGGIQVALKIIHDLGRKKGGKELRALQLLKDIRHPNLVPVTAFWLKDANGTLIDADAEPSAPETPQAGPLRGTMMPSSEPVLTERQPEELVIAMGLAERSLFDRMEECHSGGLAGIPQEELLTYMEDAARAIDLLNTRHNIQHCDIKPQNILIVSGAAQVCDFGLAKAIGDMRESSMAAGTIAYGAPEVFLGPRPSHSTDQYSLAISYYELRTGRLPFQGEAVSDVLHAKQYGTLDLSRVSEAERQVLSRASALDPDERYSSTTNMVRELRRCCSEDAGGLGHSLAEPSTAPPPTHLGPTDETMVVDQQTRQPGEPPVSVADKDQIIKTFNLAASDTRTSPVGEIAVGGTEPSVGPERRRRWKGTLVGLLCLTLIAAAVGAPVVKSFQFHGEVQKLIDGGEYQTAFRRIESPPAWFGWLVDQDRLRKTLEDKWLSEAHAAYTRGETARALSACDDLMKVLGDCPRALELRQRILKDQRDADRPDTDVKWLELVQKRTDQALTAIDDQPERSIEHCNEAIGLLDELGSSEDEDRQQRVRLLWHRVLLTRARARSRVEPPPWKQVSDDLVRLRGILSSGEPETPSQRALRTALTVLAADASGDDGSRDPLELLDLLVENRKALDQLMVPDQWTPDETERQRARAVGDRVIGEVREFLLKMADRPLKGLELSNTLLEYQPDNVDALMCQADFHVLLQDYDRGQKTLQQAHSKAVGGQQQLIGNRTEAIGTLVVIGDADKHDRDQVLGAMKKAHDLRDAMSPAMKLSYCASLVKLAATRDQFRDSCFAFLPDVLNHLPDSLQAKQLHRRYVELRKDESQQVRYRVVAAVDSIKQPDYQALYRQCVDAEKMGLADGFVQAVRAETLIEGADFRPAADCWGEAEAAAFDTNKNIDSADQPYQLYVQALVRGSRPDEPQWEEAAELLDRAFTSSPLSSVLDKKYRRQRAIGILTAAAAGLRLPVSKTSFDELLTNPFGSRSQAGKASVWLARARQLSGETPLPVPSRINDSLARWHKEEPDKTGAGRQVAAIVGGLKPEELTRENLPLLFIHAQSSPGDTQALSLALKTCAQILRLAKEEKKVTGAEVPPLYLHEKILEPALKLVTRLPDARSLPSGDRKLVAALYAERGRLIRDNPYHDWKFDNCREEMFAAFDKAITFDDSRPEYYVGRGFARLKLPSLRLADLRVDAETAIATDAEYPGGHALLGNVLILQSRELPSALDRTPLLSKAVDSCTKAIELTDPGDKELANYLINRSAAYVEWANFTIDTTLKSQQRLLTEARTDGQKAVDLETPYRDYAYRALGNATEDLAWLVKKRELYPDAIKAFGGAIEERADMAVAWMDRGRCRFKAVGQGGYDAEMLDDAVKDLTEAARRNPSLAEAHYWLGRIENHRRDYDEANSHLSKALQIDPKYHPAAFWKANVAAARGKFAESDPLFETAVRLASEAKSVQRLVYLMEWAGTIQPTDPEMASRAEKLKGSADRFAGDSAPEAGLFVGRVRELQEKWDDAIKAYDHALKTKATYPGAKSLLHYGRSEARYLSTGADADLKKADSQIVRDADMAAESAVDSNIAAIAHAHAAQARTKSSQLRNDPKLRAKAIESYRKAIAAAPEHPLGWSWRLMLVSNWQFVDPALHQDTQKYEQAKQYLDEAFAALPADHPYKSRIGRMRADFQRKREDSKNR